VGLFFADFVQVQVKICIFSKNYFCKFVFVLCLYSQQFILLDFSFLIFL